MKSLPYLFVSLTLFLATTSHAIEKPLEEACDQNVCTKTQVYKSKRLTKHPVLVIALHGDINPPQNFLSYHSRFAKTISEKSNNVIAVGLLRPGYTDHLNRTSDGERGETVGDNYDDARVRQIGTAIEKLKSIYKPKKTVLAGHSGGAAISAKLIALKPKLVDSVFLVSCPCNINAWRSDMYKRNRYDGFKGDLTIASPLDLVEDIDPNTDITIIVGREDDITKPYLSNEYHSALTREGKISRKLVINGGHEIFMSSTVIKTILQSIKNENRAQ